MAKCYVRECSRKQYVRGLCQAHYSRLRKTGKLNESRPLRSNQVHGLTDTREYKSWESMRQRCLNPKDQAYRYYGGRGIKVCKRWNSFLNFRKDMGKRPLGKSLDRINTNGDYTPRNCRWVTQKQQLKNRRASVQMTSNS